MRERIRLMLAAFFYYTGMVRLALWWQQRSGQSLLIINYHSASGEQIRRQILYLHRHYHLMHLEQALEEFYGQCRENRKITIRRKPLVLTFDDGYRDNYDLVLSLTRELHVPITIFLIPGYIDSGKRFWWLEGEYLAHQTQVDEATIEGNTYCLQSSDGRQALARAIDARLRYARSVAERETFLSHVYDILGVPPDAVAGDKAEMPMSWSEVGELQASGWVSFGAHTMHHPILSCLSDSSEVDYEVKECRKVLEERLGLPVRTFAYPIGKPQHIGDDALLAVESVGYRWAVTTIEGRCNPQAYHFMLRRIPGDINQHWLVMASELVGLLGVLSRIRRKS